MWLNVLNSTAPNSDLLDPNGGRKPTTSVRLSYRPDDYSDTEFGAFYVDNRVPMNHPLFLQNDQVMFQ